MSGPRAVTGAAAGLWAVLRAGGGLVVDLAVPRRCALCGAFGPFLCAACTSSLPVDGRARCPGCLDPLAAPTCPHCAGTPAPPLDAVVAAYRFEEGARRLVHRLKYGRLHALGAPMGALIVPAVRSLAAVDVVVPVPLHPRRQRERGFNQSERLARPLAAALSVPVERRLLRRVRHTPHQVRQPDHAARQVNVAGAFAAAPVGGRSVLLVDDVATTGATLRACALALQQAGAARVQAISFAAGV